MGSFGRNRGIVAADVVTNDLSENLTESNDLTESNAYILLHSSEEYNKS